jgi:hypothetical protein
MSRYPVVEESGYRIFYYFFTTSRMGVKGSLWAILGGAEERNLDHWGDFGAIGTK